MQIESVRPELVQVFILAGGRGSRSSNPKIPKALQEISKGVTIADLQLTTLENSGFKNVCFLLGYKSDLMINFIELSKARYSSLIISYEIDSSIGSTARSVSEAVSKFSPIESFLVLLGDTSMWG
jgi:NDP-sugar pyrophosphorylase family protein